MGINSYHSNEEQKFAHIISDLKNLPKVKAEDNFEFNLMVKIRNRNFELSVPERKFNFNRALAPAAAVTFSIMIFFFFFTESNVNLENPFLTPPEIRTNYSAAKTDTIVLSQPEMLTSYSAEKVLTQPDIAEVPPSNIVRVVVEPSDAVTVETVDLPFDDNSAVDLDSYVTGNRVQQNRVQRGQLVSGDSHPTNFDGFFIKERASKESIELHKTKLDSLKKAQKTEKD